MGICKCGDCKCKAVEETMTFKCNACGKQSASKNINTSYILANKHHNIKMNSFGYGSDLDGYSVNFTVCDNCLISWLNGFVDKDVISDV